MCMPLFQRLRALSLKHLAVPLYARHYVHARGRAADVRLRTQHLKYHNVFFFHLIELKSTKTFAVCSLQHLIYAAGIWQYLNNCSVQEQRVRVQSIHRHHGTNAHTYTQSLIIVIGFKQNTFQQCVWVCALLTKCSQRCRTRGSDWPHVPLRWLWYLYAVCVCVCI